MSVVLLQHYYYYIDLIKYSQTKYTNLVAEKQKF